ncbi:hypothetical protein [Flavobacterium sp.]|uniref:hypothetical protein n=1 Tax=Flavobacterium sp. TaxID=239 RepID=UPI00286D8B88|nr:hypothetical protein [Flavobacterium sp.]
MARTNKISADFTATAKTAAVTKINEAKAQMPFLISLPEQERKNYGNMGPKSVAYAQQCLEGAIAFPKELKANFNLAEYQKDVTLVNNLLGVRVAVASLLELIDDTMAAGGIDIMGTSSEVYTSLKSSAKSDASVKEMVALIGERFAAQKKSRAKKQS